MGIHSVEEVSKVGQAKPNMQLVDSNAPKVEFKCNPGEILIQVLYRPQEPIHKMLMDSSYTWVDQGTGFQRVEDPFGGWINTTRSWQTRLFLERTEFKYLLMLDSDEGIPWWVPYALAEHDLPLVSGIICGFTKEKGLFACVAVKGPDGKARFPTIKSTKTLPNRGVIPVHNAGTGCLMVRRDVLEALWGAYEKDPSFGHPFELPIKEQRIAAKTGTMPRGEDICFTDRCRKLGFDVHADFSCRGIHSKIFHLDWPENQIMDIDAKTWAEFAFADSQK